RSVRTGRGRAGALAAAGRRGERGRRGPALAGAAARSGGRAGRRGSLPGRRRARDRHRDLGVTARCGVAGTERVAVLAERRAVLRDAARGNPAVVGRRRRRAAPPGDGGGVSRVSGEGGPTDYSFFTSGGD